MKSAEPEDGDWLSVLEASFIVHFLEPDSNNLGKSIIKTPKLYFVDTGLLCHLLRLEGKDELILSRKKRGCCTSFATAPDWCPGHGTILAGERPATGGYRQV